MIKLLHIENIAVIEKADIEFDAGLNVLTGETGTGKSIVIDALSAVTGGRTSRDIIRTGAESASVTAVFLDSEKKLSLNDYGAEHDESGELFITRRISADGKNVCRINGVPVSTAQLRELGAQLVDIHGQNDGRKLLDESTHLSYLDSFAGIHGLLPSFRTLFEALGRKKAEINDLTMGEAEKEYRLDTIKRQIEEIEQAKIRPGEYGELSSRRELLLNASKLTESLDSAFDALYGGEKTEGAIALITKAQDDLGHAARYSEGFLEAICERLSDMKYAAQDISDELRDFRSRLDFFPNELDELESRIDVLKRIFRKYGDETESLEYLSSIKTELNNIDDSENRLRQLEAEFESLLAQAQKLADELSQLRKKAAVTLRDKITHELSQLNMSGVEFVVEFGPAQGEYGLCINGCDTVRFLMSANAGETPGRISRIASGGELARIMLALKNVLSDGQETATMVFDEIDTGVSGVAAQRVGEKLSKLSVGRQVLCVTHLPQIAVMADFHFEIQKNVEKGRTFTNINKLDFEGRTHEIARLIGGEIITETTLTSAAEQLTAAQAYN